MNNPQEVPVNKSAAQIEGEDTAANMACIGDNPYNVLDDAERKRWYYASLAFHNACLLHNGIGTAASEEYVVGYRSGVLNVMQSNCIRRDAYDDARSVALFLNGLAAVLTRFGKETDNDNGQAQLFTVA